MKCVEKTGKKSKTSRTRAIFRGGRAWLKKSRGGLKTKVVKLVKVVETSGVIFLEKVKNAIFTVKNAFSVKGGQQCPV